MKALLDTHALLWWLFDDPHLSTTARDFIANAENEILVSAASAWEIATKHRIGKLPEAEDIARLLPMYLPRRASANSVSPLTMACWRAPYRVPIKTPLIGC